MRLLLDSARVQDIRHWILSGCVYGGTTNPTLLLRDVQGPVDVALREIVDAYAPLPVSLEVTRRDIDELRAEALALATLGDNVVVKVPVLLPGGADALPLINELAGEGISVNATACFTAIQVYLACTAGARYASLLWGRILDEGSQPAVQIDCARRWMNRDGIGGEIVLGSLRTVGDILQAMDSSADVLTVPGELLGKLMHHRYAQATSDQFFADGSELTRDDPVPGPGHTDAAATARS